MPHISMFFGIIIRMFHNEHNPPHLHIEYQGQRASFDFEGNVVRGKIRSRTARKLIQEWIRLHKKELLENWDRGEQGTPLNKIAPLD